MSAPTAPTAPAAPSRSDQHAAIARVASAQNASRSTFENGVSRHQMPPSASFTNLRAILAAAAGHERRAFVGTVNGTICVSINFNYEPPKASRSLAKTKKRGRDDNDDAVTAAVQRVKRGLQDSDNCTDEMLSSAHAALYALLTRLSGANGETVVESWGLSFKRPEVPLNGNAGPSGTATRPRLILSARLTPGVAVPLPSLLQCLGAQCSSDGMITIQSSEALAPGFNLPLSEQARAAETHGQRAITMFATVAAK